MRVGIGVPGRWIWWNLERVGEVARRFCGNGRRTLFADPGYVLGDREARDEQYKNRCGRDGSEYEHLISPKDNKGNAGGAVRSADIARGKGRISAIDKYGSMRRKRLKFGARMGDTGTGTLV